MPSTASERAVANFHRNSSIMSQGMIRRGASICHRAMNYYRNALILGFPIRSCSAADNVAQWLALPLRSTPKLKGTSPIKVADTLSGQSQVLFEPAKARTA